MNGKTAKKLRKLAAEIGRGANTYVAGGWNLRTSRCSDNSQRGVYKRLKKAYNESKTALTKPKQKKTALECVKLMAPLPGKEVLR